MQKHFVNSNDRGYNKSIIYQKCLKLGEGG